MEIIDSEGRLFGLVNIIDAFVVLFVVVIGVAGVALVLGGSEEADANSGSKTIDVGTTHATLDLGTRPDTIADAIEEGDTYSPGGRSTLTITDLYLAPAQDGTRVFARVELRGPTTDAGMVSTSYDGGPPRLGRSLSITTPRYDVSGTIQSVGGGPSLDTSVSRAVFRATVPSETARLLTVGDAYTVAGRNIGTVESVSVYGTDSPDRKLVYVGLTLETLETANITNLGGDRLRRGTSITFRSDDYQLSGNIVRLGSTEQRGSPATRSVRLRMENLSPQRAGMIREGMVERAGGDTVARLVDVERTPSQVLVTSSSGEVFLRDHPVNEDLTLTANLSVRETPDGVQFKGETIQPGSNVTLDLGSVTIQVEVVSV